MKLNVRIFLSLYFLIFSFCGLRSFAQKISYNEEIEQWHKQRIKELRADDGWLNLVGLFWLQEGTTSFGAGSQNNIVFPKSTIADFAGYFERSGKKVILKVLTGVLIKVNGKAVHDAEIFNGDGYEGPIVTSGNLQWVIIKREDKIGVRLRNLKSPAVAAFKDTERFKVDSTWKIPAHLENPEKSGTILITNVIGQTSQEKSAGKLSFSIHGKKYSLNTLREGNELFIIFSDLTSGVSTYPSGRFVYAQIPGADGITYIDFNKSYSPPCAFTKFATCPLPPKENRLSLSITAGEKYKNIE
jgi:uncharacterized protein